jgi:hypothetical protein
VGPVSADDIIMDSQLVRFVNDDNYDAYVTVIEAVLTARDESNVLQQQELANAQALTQEMGRQSFLQMERAQGQEYALGLQREAAAEAAREAERAASMAARYEIDGLRTSALGGMDFLGSATSGLGQMGSYGGVQIFDPTALDDVETMRDRVDDIMDTLTEAEQRGVISESDLENARGLAGQAQAFATEAERGAAAYDRIANNLGAILGQDDGGLAGQIGDQVMADARAGGMSDDQLAELERALDMASGRMNDSAAMFEDSVIPQIAEIAEQYGPEAAAEAMMRAEQQMQANLASGGSAADLLELMRSGQMTGYTGTGGAGFTVAPGDTVSGIAARTGMSPEDVMAQAGISDPRNLQPGSYGGGMDLNPVDAEAVASSMTTVEGAMDVIGGLLPDIVGSIGDFSGGAKIIDDLMSSTTSQAERFQGIIKDLTSMPQKLVIDIEMIGQAGALLNLLAMMKGATQDNGGVAPGSTPGAVHYGMTAG